MLPSFTVRVCSSLTHLSLFNIDMDKWISGQRRRIRSFQNVQAEHPLDHSVGHKRLVVPLSPSDTYSILCVIFAEVEPTRPTVRKI